MSFEAGNPPRRQITLETGTVPPTSGKLAAAYTFCQLVLPFACSRGHGLQTTTTHARPKRTIGDNHAAWKEICIEEPSVNEEANLGAQSHNARPPRTKPGDGALRGTAYERPSIEV